MGSALQKDTLSSKTKFNPSIDSVDCKPDSSPKHKIVKFQYIERKDNQQAQVVELSNNDVLNADDQENLKQIIVVQLSRYTRLLNSKLQPDEDAIKPVRNYLAQLGCPYGILKDHISKEKHPFRSTEDSKSTRMASNLTPGRSFMATYYETRTLISPWDIEIRAKFSNPTTDEFELICANTGHQIQMHEWHQERNQGPLMIVPRNCTFWCKKTSVDGWNGKLYDCQS
jgi:hypothetical protein